MKNFELFEEAALEECYEMTMVVPVSKNWVDVNKSTEHIDENKKEDIARGVLDEKKDKWLHGKMHEHVTRACRQTINIGKTIFAQGFESFMRAGYS